MSLRLGLGLRLGNKNRAANAISDLVSDIYPAFAAYSLRYLKSTYNGPVIRVRESVGGTQQDFTPIQILNGTLVSFCGAGDGFVTTIYDQIGSSNLVNTIASEQPRIVISGTLNTVNEKPAIRFNGTSSFLFNAALTTTQPDTTFVVYKLNSLSAGQVIVDEHNSSTGSDGKVINFAASEFRSFNGNTTDVTYATANTNQNIHSILANSTSSVGRLNGVSNNLSNGTNGFDGIRLGKARRSIGAFFAGDFQELIIYNNNQSENFIEIENLINKYYSVY